MCNDESNLLRHKLPGVAGACDPSAKNAWHFMTGARKIHINIVLLFYILCGAKRQFALRMGVSVQSRMTMNDPVSNNVVLQYN